MIRSKTLGVVRPISLLCLLAFFNTQAQSESAHQILGAETLGNLEIKPSSSQVSIAKGGDPATAGIVMTVQGGPEGYPGVAITKKDGTPWNLSTYGHVEAKVTNTGAKRVGVTLRIDNKADWKLNPFNAETVFLEPGKSGTVSVIFGHSLGKKPGYPLKPSEVSNMLVFLGKTATTQSVRIESIVAAGPSGEKAKIDPATIRVKPTNGFLLGSGVVIDPAKQAVAKEGATAAPASDGHSVRVNFTKTGQSVTLKPVEGMWDLRDGYQVRVKLKNTGKSPATPSVRVNSKPGNTDKASPAKVLNPGTSVEIVASFIPAVPWKGAGEEGTPEAGTGTKFTSDAASGLTILPDESAGEQAYEIESIKLEAPLVQTPEWLGKRPPVDGDWVQTFAEEFDGDKINLRKWNIYTANFWDKKSHFSKDNVIVRNGVAILRYEKKTGRHNDYPNGKETEYATGFIDTYGKWVQRYGYFEARMKLPKAPGLWPAFWLMPDRGLQAGEQWKRADTANGGMEFDIMEFLSRWGVYRFTTALHWDGYGKQHKATGSAIYTGHDEEGFITSGVLWLPGLTVLYNNGKEVGRWESPRISNVVSDLMFTHVTGGWDNNKLDDAQLPDDFVIDYVRCWQRKDLASSVDGVKSTQETPAAPTTPDP